VIGAAAVTLIAALLMRETARGHLRDE